MFAATSKIPLSRRPDSVVTELIRPDPAGSVMTQNIDDIRRGYDLAADNYSRQFLDELDEKPFDRECLANFAASYRDRSHDVIDIGCGTGQTTAFLADHSLNVTGIDLSPRMITAASANFPKVAFEVGDMFRLDRPDDSVDGIVAFYAIVNNPPDDLAGLFEEFARVLRTGGQLLLAFHAGEGIVVQDDFLNSGARLVFHFHLAEQVAEDLKSVGLRIEKSVQRDPYPSEYPSQRAYLLATK